MSAKYLSTTLVKFVICLLLIALLAKPVPAVKKWRESNRDRGWQIWIAAVDFDRRDADKVIKTGKEAQKHAKAAPKPWLAKDIVIAPGPQQVGFNDYDFQSPEAGKAFLACRIMDFRGGGQSWWITINNVDAQLNDQNFVKYKTEANWQWKRINKAWELKKGRNTVRIVPREADAAKETLMDVFVISNAAYRPLDEHFIRAKKKTAQAVQPARKLATMWGAIKRGL